MKSVICSSSAGCGGSAACKQARALVRLIGQLTSPIESEFGHVGALAQPFVAPLLLAKRRFGSGHVEDVVDDLEEDAQLARKCAVLVNCRRSPITGYQEYAFDARPNQAPGLQFVQVTQALGAGRDRLGDIHELTADHAVHAGRRGELAGGGQELAGFGCLLGQEQAERLGEEAIAGQDRHVLAERLVAGETATPEVVVVHGRKVVVDQRVGVDQLDRRPERKHRGPGQPERAGCGEHQDGPDPLAAGQQRVAHRLLQPGGGKFIREAQCLQVPLDLRAQMLGVGWADRRARRGHGGLRGGQRELARKIGQRLERGPAALIDLRAGL